MRGFHCSIRCLPDMKRDHCLPKAHLLCIHFNHQNRRHNSALYLDDLHFEVVQGELRRLASGAYLFDFSV